VPGIFLPYLVNKFNSLPKRSPEAGRAATAAQELLRR
jgi:hypothetical protein